MDPSLRWDDTLVSLRLTVNGLQIPAYGSQLIANSLWLIIYSLQSIFLEAATHSFSFVSWS